MKNWRLGFKNLNTGEVSWATNLSGEEYIYTREGAEKEMALQNEYDWQNTEVVIEERKEKAA